MLQFLLNQSNKSIHVSTKWLAIAVAVEAVGTEVVEDVEEVVVGVGLQAATLHPWAEVGVGKRSFAQAVIGHNLSVTQSPIWRPGSDRKASRRPCVLVHLTGSLGLASRP